MRLCIGERVACDEAIYRRKGTVVPSIEQFVRWPVERQRRLTMPPHRSKLEGVSRERHTYRQYDTNIPDYYRM